jgi:TRAP-type C4-dicarboxylate transport system permease small subunit
MHDLATSPAPRWLASPVAVWIVAVLRAVLSAVRFVVNVVAIGLLSAMIFLIMFQILGRYVFNYSISWSEELAVYSQIWLVMLGAGIAMRNRHHASVDILITRMPTPVQLVFRSASALLVVWFLLVVITSSSSMLAFGMIVSSPALQLPMAVPYAALPIGLSYFLLEFAIATLPDIWKPAKTAAAPELSK